MRYKKNSLKQEGNNNLAIQDSEVTFIVSSADELLRLTREGKLDEAATLLKQLSSAMDTVHPFYPHYRYKTTKVGSAVLYEHEPTSKEAAEKFPLTYKGKFNINRDQIGQLNNINELIEDAYVKQKTIEIDMVSFQVWIGNHPVDTPLIDEALRESKWVIAPQPLPPPLKLKMYFEKKGDEDKTIIDYLEMSIREIDRETGIIILSNHKQKNAPILVNITIQMREGFITNNNTNINLKIRDEHKSIVKVNKDFLTFLSVAMEENATLVFKNLESGTNFILSKDFTLNGEYSDLKEELEFFECLYELENYYNVTFSVPKEMKEEDYTDINILKKTMRRERILQRIKSVTFTFDNKELIGNILREAEKNANKLNKFAIIQSGSEARYRVLGTEIPIQKLTTIYHCLTVDDIEKLKRKLNDMDDGETVKVRMLPGQDDSVEDIYEFR